MKAPAASPRPAASDAALHPALAPAPAWSWPLDVGAYDRTPALRPGEAVALATLVGELDRRLPWPALAPQTLARVVRPVEDALAAVGIGGQQRTAVLRTLASETHRRGRVLWGWTPAEWVETLGATERAFRRRHRGFPGKRQALIAVAYLLSGFADWGALGLVNRLALARKVFGRSSRRCVVLVEFGPDAHLPVLPTPRDEA